jgi:hypothetical protein
LVFMNTYLIYFNNILRDIILAQSLHDAKKQCIRIRRDNKYTGVLSIHSLY